MLLRKMGYLIEALAPDMRAAVVMAAVAAVVMGQEVMDRVDVTVLVQARVRAPALDAVLVDVRTGKKSLESGTWHNCEVPLSRE
jgi:hypothetical protein